jgi:hypothetical protein
MSHDPLIEDDFEEDTPVFEAGSIRDFDYEAHAEAKEHAGAPERGRDTKANEENSKEEDESENLADRGQLRDGGPVEARSPKDSGKGDKQTKASDVTPRGRKEK